MFYWIVFTAIATAMIGYLFPWVNFYIGQGPYLAWLIALTITTFVLYGLDKGFAKLEFWRIPEDFLHGLAYLGGFMGGFFGMLVFHHKTSDDEQPKFIAPLFSGFLIHVALLVLIMNWNS